MLKTKPLKLIIFLSVIVLLCMYICFVSAENYSWTCPECNRTDNIGNFCGNCGHPRPISDPSSEPTTIPQNIEDQIPVLTKLYPSIQTNLKTRDERWYAQYGPGKEYAKTTNGYKTDSNHSNTVTMFFCENDWVYIDIKYSSASERYAYLPRNAVIDSDKAVQISELDSFDGETNTDVFPYWGPDNSFDQNSDCAIQAHTTIKAFFQENGYVYCEFLCAIGKVRMWLPLNSVSF